MRASIHAIMVQARAHASGMKPRASRWRKPQPLGAALDASSQCPVQVGGTRTEGLLMARTGQRVIKEGEPCEDLFPFPDGQGGKVIGAVLRHEIREAVGTGSSK